MQISIRAVCRVGLPLSAYNSPQLRILNWSNEKRLEVLNVVEVH